MRTTRNLLLLLALTGCGSGKDGAVTENAAQPGSPAPAPGAPGNPAATASAPQGNAAQAPAAPADGKKKLTPQEGLALSRELIAKRDFQNALTVLTQVVRAQPNYVEAYVQRANLLAAANRTTLAIEDLTAAIKFQSDNAKLFNSRGYLHLQLKQYDEALADFERATSLDTSFAQPINNRGLVRISQGDFETALKDFAYALQLDPKYFDALNNRGFVFTKQGKVDEAIAAFTEAVTINPNYVNGWVNRGQAYMQARKYDQAAADFSKLITLQPGNLQFYQLRAEAFRELGKTSEAARDQAHVQWTQTLAQLNRDLAKNPKDADAWVARGRHLLLEDKFSEALADFERALKAKTDHAPALLGRAMVWARQGKEAEALQACTAIIEKSGELEAYSLRGDLLLRGKQFDAAIADFEAAHRFDSQVAEAYMGRAELRKGRGEIQQASADIAQAQSLDPKLRPANYEVPARDGQEVARPLPNRSQR